MKRTLKNILMILLIIVVLFLTYFTIGYLKGDFSLNNRKIELNAHVIYMNEENATTTETVDENGNVTTTIIDDGTGDGTTEVTNDEVDPDTTVTNEDDILYTTTDENIDISATSGLSENDATEKSLDLLDGNVSYVYYIVFGVEGLLFSFTLAYLAYSKFNKLTFKETFYSAGRIVMYILYSLTLTVNYVLVVNYFLSV